MLELTDDALTQMNVMLTGRRDSLDINRSFNVENEINNYRNQLRCSRSSMLMRGTKYAWRRLRSALVVAPQLLNCPPTCAL
jgi:hypothetical protein